MNIIEVAFGVSLLVTGGLALGSSSPRLSLCAWGSLVAGWMVSTTVANYGDRYVWLFPLMDVVIGTWAMHMAFRRKCYWIAILGLIFFGDCLTHIGYAALRHLAPADPLRVYRYYAALNLLLVAQMVCVAWPGLSNGVSIFLRGLRRILGNRHNPEVAP